jgi:hypothetical protein
VTDQTWPYHFCNAYRAARSDRLFGKDRRLKKSQTKSDRLFLAISPYLAGYSAGWDSPEEVREPMPIYRAWIAQA